MKTIKKSPKEKAKTKLKPLKQRQADALLNKGGKAAKKIKGARKDRFLNKDGLSAQEEEFCEIFGSDREFFGNGVQSYIEAFDIEVVLNPNHKYPQQKTYESCKVAAHKLLTRNNLLIRINQVFESRGLNDTFVDKQLEKVITQDAEFSSKVQAIREYNKLKKRTVVQVEHTHSFAKYDSMTDEELEKSLAEGEKFFKKLW